MWWKKLVIPFAVFVMASCASQKSADIDIITTSYTNDYSEVSVQTLKITDEDGTEFELNDKFLAESDAIINSFDKDAKEAVKKLSEGVKCSLQVTQEVSYNKNDFISATQEESIYLGGAHGMTVRKTRNIDLCDCRELKLSDLFAEEGYKDTLKRLINEIKEKKPEEYSELWAQPEIKDNQDFYINDDYLVIYYQPYELSYYARGFVEFPIRLTELQGYMKEEYYRLIP